MRGSPSTLSRRAAWVTAWVTAFLGVWLLVFPAGKTLRDASFDTVYSVLGATQPLPAQPPILIVYLDLQAFKDLGLDPKQPWPYDQHAKVLDRLTQAGASAVVYDLLFNTANPDAAPDRAFAEAIRRNGRVVLAAEIGNSSQGTSPDKTPWAQVASLVLPHPFFLQPAAGWGLAEVQPDQDFVVRRHFTGWAQEQADRPSLAVAAVRQLARTQGTTNSPRRSPHTMYMRYYGDPLSMPHVSIGQLLEGNGVPDDVIRGRVVLIGAYSMSGRFPDRRDEFRSPLRTWGAPPAFMPGVEVHATQVTNMIRNDGLHLPPAWLELFAVAAGGLVLGLVVVRQRSGTALTLGAASIGVIALGTFLSFRHWNLWWNWLIPAIVQVPTALGGAVVSHWMDWFLRRRQLEEARRADEARIREQAALIEKAHDAILVQDLKGGVRFANASAHKLFGWELPPNPSKPLQVPFLPQETQLALDALRAKGEWNGELHVRGNEGRDLVLESRWTWIRKWSDDPGIILNICTDVTERRQLEAEALRAQRMEAIGSLAGGMAHDLNNALAPVLLGAQLLRREVSTDSAGRLLDLIENGAARGAGMVKQVLLFARGKQGQMGAVDLRTLAEEMAQLARDTFPRSIRITTQLADDAGHILGNATELHQVLLNLAVNARDAMPNGGSLCLAVDHVHLDAAEAEKFQGAPVGEYVSLLVSDTGTGIPASVLPKIFNAFFTTKPEGVGTGLGLSTTARIVRGHGGFISVTSHEGEGTTFEILFPRHAEAAQESAAPESAPVLRGNGELLLLVDDDVTALELLKRSLDECGFKTHKATDGAEVIAFVTHTAQEAAQQPRLLLCNDTLPTPDGTPAWAQLRKAFPTQPLILLSRSAQAPAGAEGVVLLQKPFDWPTLCRILEECMEREVPRNVG